MDIQAIARLTLEYGGEWGLRHSERLLRLAELLAGDAPYNLEVVRLAAYLHDWGAYAKWAQPGVEHHLRSREVAEAFLGEQGCAPELAAAVLECIEHHHGGPEKRSFESRLFTDADALDLLGVVGAARVFAMNARDLRAGWAAVQAWRDKSIAALSLPQSRRMAERRIEETNAFLERFAEETFGIF